MRGSPVLFVPLSPQCACGRGRLSERRPGPAPAERRSGGRLLPAVVPSRLFPTLLAGRPVVSNAAPVRRVLARVLKTGPAALPREVLEPGVARLLLGRRAGLCPSLVPQPTRPALKGKWVRVRRVELRPFWVPRRQGERRRGRGTSTRFSDDGWDAAEESGAGAAGT